MTTERKRKGMGEYKRERHGTMFTLPKAEKARLNDFAAANGGTIRSTIIDALNRLYLAHGKPPIRDAE